MDDNDDLFFSFDDDEEESDAFADDESSSADGEGSQNRIFLIGVIALAAISVLGIGLFAAFYFLQPRDGGGEVSANELTNQANIALLSATQTAEFLTQTAPTATPTAIPEEPTEVPTTEATTEPTKVPTPLGQPTEEATGEALIEGATEVAEVTGDTTPTALSPAETDEPEESGIIEVTPLGGGSNVTPVPTGVGGPVAPDDSGGGGTAATGGNGAVQQGPVATLPSTGFTGSAGIAGAGILALALVVIAVAARRIRLK